MSADALRDMEADLVAAVAAFSARRAAALKEPAVAAFSARRAAALKELARRVRQEVARRNVQKEEETKMSLSDAKRVLQWNVVRKALADADVDSETVKLVESSRDASNVFHAMASMLMGASDVAQAKNYVKVEMTGLIAPFDRAYVELVRHGGKTSHELRQLLHDRLVHVRRLLADGVPTEGMVSDIVSGIDDVLAEESA